MILSHIVAITKNRAIGKNNDILFRLPEDQKFFRETTLNHILIMGRKTFDSLGRVLPKRFHIVVSRQQIESHDPLVQYVSNLDEAYELAKSQVSNWPDEVFIIGGSEIYRQTLEHVDRIYLTEIDKVVDGDSFYPEVDWSQFRLEQKNHFETSEKFSISVFCRKS